jgi:hypothetical protein
MRPKYNHTNTNDPRNDVEIDFNKKRLKGRMSGADLNRCLHFFRKEKMIDRCWIILRVAAGFLLVWWLPGGIDSWSVLLKWVLRHIPP